MTTPTDSKVDVKDNLRLRCNELVRSLGLPTRRKLTVPGLCDHISRLRDRSIQLVPMRISVVDGLWVSTRKGVDYIAFEEHLAPMHQLMVILHELAHMICDHDSPPDVDTDQHPLWPSLNPEMVQRLLRRAHADTSAEREAEYVGSLLGLRTLWTPDLTRCIPSEADAVVTRLSALLDRRR